MKISDGVAKPIRMSYVWSYTDSSIVAKCLWRTIQSQGERTVFLKLFHLGTFWIKWGTTETPSRMALALKDMGQPRNCCPNVGHLF